MASLKQLLDHARTYVGVKEIPGYAQNNPVIVSWIREFARNVKSRIYKSRDETPWCAVFVSKVLKECGFEPTYNALAASYARYGLPAKPEPGAIIVIRHLERLNESTGSATGYHVGFLVKITKHHYVILGGNQSNQVRVTYFPKRRFELVALRAPQPRA